MYTSAICWDTAGTRPAAGPNCSRLATWSLVSASAPATRPVGQRARPRCGQLIQVAHAVRPAEHPLDRRVVQPHRVLRLAGGAGGLNQLHSGSARAHEEDPAMIVSGFWALFCPKPLTIMESGDARRAGMRRRRDCSA